MLIELGSKIIDLEEPGRWGIVWRLNPVSQRLRVRWCDGSMSLGLHCSVVNSECGYELSE